MTIGQLAALSGLHYDTVWLIENARRGMSVVTLVRLRNALNCSWGDLLGGCKSEIVRGRAKFLNIVSRTVDGENSSAATKKDSGFHGKECYEETIKKTLGANLRRLRESSKTQSMRQLSTDQLARLTALNDSSIWRFENGKSGMTVATLIRLKEAFGCSWNDLLGGCEGEIAAN